MGGVGRGGRARLTEVLGFVEVRVHGGRRVWGVGTGLVVSGVIAIVEDWTLDGGGYSGILGGPCGVSRFQNIVSCASRQARHRLLAPPPLW